jgi:hypothetical protein
MTNSYLKDLDKVLTKVSAEKKAAVQKIASPGDGAEDGTKKPETGAQMASNKSEAGKSTKAMIDGGAVANPANASVENSTDGATAVATDGKSGTKGADLEVSGKAPGSDGKTASDLAGLDLAKALRKAAESLDAPTAVPVTKVADAKGSEVSSVTSALDCFLARAARSSLQIKSAAEGGPSDQQVGGDMTEKLLSALESGQIGEEDAEKMLTEMAQSGAISEQDLIQAMQAMHQAGGQGGQDPSAGAGAPPAGPDAAAMGGAGAPPAGPDAGAMGGAGAPPMDPAAGAGAPPAGPEMGGDPAMQAKMAAAHIDEKHPQYLEKLAAFYPGDLDAGYDICLKVAEFMAGQADGQAPKDDDQSIPDPIAGPKAPEGGDPMTDDSAVLSPQHPDEQKALQDLLAQMGLTVDDLKQLAAMKHQAPAGMDPKVAAYREKAMTCILRKTAQAHLAAIQTSGAK